MISFDENMPRHKRGIADIAFDDTRTTDVTHEFVPPDDGLHLEIYAPKRRGIVARVLGAIFRPIFLVLTSQAVVTAVLVCFVAVVTAQHASQIIGAKFSAINSALKRLTP